MSTAVAPKSIQDQIQGCQDRIRDLSAEAEAILETATNEERGLTNDEKARYDAIVGPPGQIGKSGLLKDEEDQLLRWQDMEARKDQIALTQNTAARRGVYQALGGGARDGDKADQFSPQDQMTFDGARRTYSLGARKPVLIPASAARYRPLGKEWENRHTGRRDPAAAYAAGRWFMAAVLHDPQSIRWCNDHGIPVVKDQQQIGDPAKGGYLVPVELSNVVYEVRETYGVAARFCRRENMISDTKNIAKFLTGLTAAPAAELSDLIANNETDKTWSQVQLIARKWATYTKMSSEIDEDAIIDLGADLAREIGIAFAYAEDDSLFNGDGTGTYNSITGIKSALAAGAKVTGSGNTFAALTYADFEAMIGKVPNVAGLNPRWYIHKSAWAASMQSLINAAGGNTIPIMEAGAQQRDGSTLDNAWFLGYPVTFLNVGLPLSGEGSSVAGAAFFADLNLGASLGMRRDITVNMDASRHFDEDAIAVKGTERFDIYVHERGTASDAGTIVQLDFAL